MHSKFTARKFPVNASEQREVQFRHGLKVHSEILKEHSILDFHKGTQKFNIIRKQIKCICPNHRIIYPPS